MFTSPSPRLVDNFPAATVFKNLKTGELQYEDGFKLGFSYTSHVVINNHLKIRIKYHTIPKLVPCSYVTAYIRGTPLIIKITVY